MNALNKKKVGEGVPVGQAVIDELCREGIVGPLISIIGTERVTVFMLTPWGKSLYDTRFVGARGLRISAKDSALAGIERKRR